MLLCVYEHTMQAIIIEDVVVEVFRGRALVINFLISIRATWDIGVKSDIPFWPSLDNPVIFGRGAGVFIFGTVLLPIGAAPHEAAAGSVKTIGLHMKVFLA